MLLDFRCGDCGETFERLVPRGDSTPRACECGGTAKRVYGVFNQKQYVVDRSTWELVAPLHEDGRPMTMKEASKHVDHFNPSEQAREVARLRQQQEEHDAQALETAKREAWAELSAKRRIVV